MPSPPSGGSVHTPPSAKQNELARLQSEITNEISRDAPAIARGVFGDNKNHPDMSQVSNARLDAIYRQAYLSGDRQFLQQEARRDPQQFLDVAKRIGVSMPSTAPGVQPPPGPNAFAQAVSANPQAALAALSQPAGPAAAPAMPPAPALPAASPVPLPGSPPVSSPAPPVILGPNGQPLPPSGVGIS